MNGDAPRVGYVGLGQMGSAMAGRLLETGVQLIVFDLNPETMAEAVGLGAEPAGSTAEVAAFADVVSICVPDAHHVSSVLDGLGEGAVVGLPVLVHSTIHPDAVAACRMQAAIWGGVLHDVCVAGGAVAASAGELVLFVGGRADLPPAAATLLSYYSSHIVEAGPVGSGAAMKLAFNVLTYAQFAASAVAFEIAEGAEVDTDALVDAWRHVGQLGSLTEQFLPVLSIPAEHVVGDFRDSLRSTVGIARKDLRLAADLCVVGVLGGIVEALEKAMPEVFGVADEIREAP